MAIELKATFFSIFIVILHDYIFYSFFNNKIHICGKLQQQNEKFSVFNLHQSLGSVKDIKVYKSEEFFINKFKYFAKLSASYVAKAHVLRILSRHYLELVAIVGLITFIFISLRGNDFVDIIPVLGIFFASIIRLLPSANRIILALQLLRYGKEHTRILENELKLKIIESNVKKLKIYLLKNISNFQMFHLDIVRKEKYLKT